MANDPKKDVFNANDSFDINELASLNDDFSAEFIEQLQNQISINTGMQQPQEQTPTENDNELFEEIPKLKQQEAEENISRKLDKINENIDDNFILKYKAKIKKQNQMQDTPPQEPAKPEPPKFDQPVQEEAIEETKSEEAVKEIIEAKIEKQPAQPAQKPQISNEKIEKLTGGNITEKPLSNDQLSYNESLDYLDDNIKYSKYVIYIDPENQEFIDSLTVKERKNLINRILKEQDDIAITKKRLNLMQTFIKHAIIAIITISIAIPIVYTTINASLEASINNYRRSQGLFQTLYKQHGKIKNTKY